MGSVAVVRMAGIRRTFGSTVALNEASFEVREGEIHALLGENGAGKTTLMRILAGLDRPDAGRVFVRDREVRHFDPRLARDLGIAMVQQHFTLVPTLSPGENLVLARPEGRILPRRSEMRKRVAQLIESYRLPLRADVPASELSVGEQQRLEILRALDAGARILILDEPTAVLTDAEAERLIAVCRELTTRGLAIVMVTHRLAEVGAAADRVTVLRGGECVLNAEPAAGRTKEALIQLMVGASVSLPDTARHRGTGSDPRPRLAVRGLHADRLSGVTFEVPAGKVLGIAGVDGNGQAELERVLSGRAAPDSGAIELDGTRVELEGPRRRIDAGIAYIPSDRYRWGLVPGFDLAENLELGRSPRWRRSKKVRMKAALTALAEWDVRAAGPDMPASTLSGGNAQKLVLARELAGSPRILLACYATRGLDPEAAASVVRRVETCASEGAAILWIGAELDELFAISDQLLVLTAGRIMGPFSPPFDRHEIGLVMAGEMAQPTAETVGA